MGVAEGLLPLQQRGGIGPSLLRGLDVIEVEELPFEPLPLRITEHRYATVIVWYIPTTDSPRTGL